MTEFIGFALFAGIVYAVVSLFQGASRIKSILREIRELRIEVARLGGRRDDNR